ncbi:MAG: hypothetical protein UX80_C0008G0006 [Candidatus Amesbacteria bacterium GW2011_GWA2_47_11b]|uniref:Uncharacterized protein n=3 Tax=Candidatus Amesiibacteriota TaxID=1752730 RepID=A0A0G1SKV1_9BACT|nr:MAG: seg [Microgenomates group bacterium GW2011_GWC1_46_20]KKU57893.1 MAG: hypothetical protein UX80_C0008G0006 [Candidatus Amesbacteria bacterium GW2011_GWA2_47_11b]KKU70067.1 MAG: hypothetical protein UX92_C0005G0038 [Candidatus Amesbacteria bacterium GW2011_GWA1_47_20]KKU83921.1 MAG: hypothetical protein UY11_C0010G0006 [Candidatus Amesbacteria bacterium GW2011_GWC2_47_8]
MHWVTVKCGWCKKEYKKNIYHYLQNQILGHKSFCSQKCLVTSRLRRKTVVCENPKCQKMFERPIGQISHHNYCSHRCAASMTNLSRPRKVRICPNCQKKFFEHRKYCSLICVPKTQPKYSREDLLNKIKRFHKLHKRIPIKKEFYSNWQAYRRIFGSWNKAIQEAGFIPNLERFTHKYLARDGHICDSLSEKIIDNWLTVHHLSHEHGVCYPGQTKFKTDFLVEDKHWIGFPGLRGQLKRYDELYEEKKELTKRLKIKIVEILPTDIFPKNQLDSKLGFLLQ